MERISNRAGLAMAMAVWLAAGRAGAQAPPPVRDRATVTVAPGVVEQWELVWDAPPARYCDAPDDALTCPCAGFEFGDQGRASLVRARQGRVIERFSLDALFSEGVGGILGSGAVFGRYALTPADRDALASGGAPRAILARFAGRPLRPVLVVRDYDGDGIAAEFVLQVGAGPCGHAASVLIGLGARGALHALGGSGDGQDPVVLEDPAQWEQLRTRPRSRIVLSRCGDHGSEEEESLTVRWVAGEPVPRRRARRCPRS